MDIGWHRDFGSRPSPEDYALMCRLKTGSLARLAAVLGVYASQTGADRTDTLAESLGEAAEKLGLGFQILDDVKNLRTGNPGKKRGDDIVEGKKSLPVLLLLRDRPDTGALVERCFVAARAGGAAVPEVEELIGALETTGALETAQTRGLALIAEARAALGGIPRRAGSGEARELLAALTDAIS
jgi:octaprenyl-diphosphate synthase